ncbi:hypothetical protein D6825_00095, partial [Candidatus Woesearchaeota archaeon]
IESVFTHELSDCRIITSYPFIDQGRPGDIDVIVLGDEREILEVITNQKYFKKIQQNEQIRKAALNQAA